MQLATLVLTTVVEKVDWADEGWKAALQKELDAHSEVFRKATAEELQEYRTKGKRPIPCRVLTNVKFFFACCHCFLVNLVKSITSIA